MYFERRESGASNTLNFALRKSYLAPPIVGAPVGYSIKLEPDFFVQLKRSDTNLSRRCDWFALHEAGTYFTHVHLHGMAIRIRILDVTRHLCR